MGWALEGALASGGYQMQSDGSAWSRPLFLLTTWGFFSSYLGILGGCLFSHDSQTKSRVLRVGHMSKKTSFYALYVDIIIISARRMAAVFYVVYLFLSLYSQQSLWSLGLLWFHFRFVDSRIFVLSLYLCRSNYVLALRVFRKFPCKIASWGPHVQAGFRDPVPVRFYNRTI